LGGKLERAGKAVCVPFLFFGFFHRYWPQKFIEMRKILTHNGTGR
jgi:hypothetical protein